MTEIPYDSFLALAAEKYGPFVFSREEIEQGQGTTTDLVVQLNGQSETGEWESITIYAEDLSEVDA